MSDHIPDITKMISDTPRTDAVDAKCDELELGDAIFYAIFHFEKLERELNAANAIIRQQQLLDEENLRLKDHIKRLESKLVQIDKWYQAKEAKL